MTADVAIGQHGTAEPPSVDPVAAIRRRACEQPDDTALIWRDRTVTYAELVAGAEKHRARLDDGTIEDGEPVGVTARTGPDTVALILACLTARRRVLLAPTDLPDQARRELHAAAGARFLLTSAEHVSGGDGVHSDLHLTQVLPGARPGTVAGPSGLLLLTTSGSTGIPKLVPVPEAGLARFIGWAGPRFGIGRGTRVLSFAPLHVDPSQFDVWTTLSHGGTTVLVDRRRAGDARYVHSLIERHGVAIVKAVPTLYRNLLSGPAGPLPPLPTVRFAMFGGEIVSAAHLSALPGLFPSARFFDFYGTTEVNEVTLKEVTHPIDRSVVTALGRPLPGVRTLVVDEDDTVVTGAGEGELWVRTPFQAEGYLDAARTAAAFVERPDDPVPGRWFRTGDIVARSADGRMVLHGRRDNRVKVRGQQVVLDVVEQVFAEHPGVTEAAAVGVPDEIAGTHVHVVVIVDPDRAPSRLELRAHAAARLPSSALPAAVHLRERPFDTTANGKVDRRRLAEDLRRASSGTDGSGRDRR